MTAENIKLVIVSGDPFLFYNACRLKKETGCKVILDYRDLWNDHSYYKLHYTLTRAQEAFFEEAENTSLSECDAVITVDAHLKEVIGKRLPEGSRHKIHVIQNGFDADDFNFPLPSNKSNKPKTILYFAGNIASDLNEIIFDFIRCFAELKQKLPDIYSKFEIHLKGKMDAPLFEKLRSFQLENLILQNSFVPLKTYSSEVSECDMGIIILSKEYANSYTTKFGDYLFLDKKILVLGHKGAFSDFVLENNFGEIFIPGDNYSFFERLNISKVNSGFGAEIKEKFNINSLTDKVISVFESLSS